MVAFLSILAAVVLLGITVYALHRHQTMEVEYNVDRSMPLPPLDDGDVPEVIEVVDNPDPTDPPTQHDAPPSLAAAGGEHKPPRIHPAPASRNWLEEVANLKRSGKLDAALAICEREYPLWGAYNQACIVLRLRLKQVPEGSEQEASLLSRLYTLAATAELLHDKSDGQALSLGELKKLDLRVLQELDYPYLQIGYAHLRLIRKSDIKLMQSRWGRPEGHELPRQWHSDWWQGFTAQASFPEDDGEATA